MQIQLSEHFTYKKIIAVRPSFHRHDDLYFHLRCSGRALCFQLCRQNCFCRSQPHHAASDGDFRTRFYGRYRRQCDRCKDIRRRQKETGKRIFFHAGIPTLIGGIVLSALGILFSPLIARGLGADGALLTNCVLYARITLLSMPAFMLQNVFQSFFVTAEKPKLGLGVIVIAGVTNMVLDFLLVGVFQIGLAGAAFATVTSECVGGLFPILYFARKNSSLLKLGRTHFNGKIFLCACGNGSSELMTNLSSSIVNSLYNIQLMNLAGENGVAAFGTIMYVNFCTRLSARFLEALRCLLSTPPSSG